MIHVLKDRQRIHKRQWFYGGVNLWNDCRLTTSVSWQIRRESQLGLVIKFYTYMYLCINVRGNVYNLSVMYNDLRIIYNVYALYIMPVGFFKTTFLLNITMEHFHAELRSNIGKNDISLSNKWYNGLIKVVLTCKCSKTKKKKTLCEF